MSQNSFDVEAVAKRRVIAPGAFGVALLMFFMPFCDISCNGQKAMTLTGVNLATGTQANAPSGDGDTRRVPGSFWAIIALGSAIIGAGVYLLKNKKEALYGTIAGATGFLTLFILKSSVNSAIQKEAAANGGGGGLFDMTLNIEANFLFAYWVALLAFIVAGAISYWRLKMPPGQ